MAWTLPGGQPTRVDASSGTTIAVGTVTPSSGDVVVVWGFWYGGGASGTTASAQDNNGKTYTVCPNSPSPYGVTGGQMHLLYRLCDGTEGDTITITFGATIVAAAMEWKFFRPPSGTPAFDDDGTANGVSDTVNAPTITIATADDFAVAGIASDRTVVSHNAPWVTGEIGTFGEGYTWDLSVASNQALNTTMDSISTIWTSIGASFKFTTSGVTVAQELPALLQAQLEPWGKQDV